METSSKQRTLKLFEASGVELEYMIVDEQTLHVKPICDQLFKKIAGASTMEIDRGTLSLNNELALHVVELKTSQPAPSLETLPKAFQAQIEELNSLLGDFGACLMPTAMHPWMDPHQELKLWPDEDNEIYQCFDRIFDCRGHGWANLQSTHLNLPFHGEREFVRLHAAIRLALPLIPALAASSPFAGGEHHGYKDYRLLTYSRNAKKIPSVTGHVIPEPCESLSDYQSLILEPIYRDLAPHDPQQILRHEWVNSRGAIARFERSAIEIRIIDIQECPQMDLAILAAITSLVRTLAEERWGKLSDYQALETAVLRDMLMSAARHGEEVMIENDEYLSLLGWKKAEGITARGLWEQLLDHHLTVPEQWQESLGVILEQGTLATRLLRELGTRPKRELLEQTYRELADCLHSGQPFTP